MKIALIFLSVMVAITHQQFQRQRERIWWSPHYYPSQPSINNYQRVYQDLQDDIQPDYRQFRPTRPIIYSEVVKSRNAMKVLLKNIKKNVSKIKIFRMKNSTQSWFRWNTKITLKKTSIRMSNQELKHSVNVAPCFPKSFKNSDFYSITY